MINFFSNYKFIFYLFNFFLILLYLYPGSLLGCFLYDDCKLQPQITADFIVSTNHLYAFVLFSIIGYLTFNKSSQFIFLTFYLIFLSIMLENKMVAAFNEVSSMIKSKKTSMRMAAFAVAIDRVAKSFELRGV